MRKKVSTYSSTSSPLSRPSYRDVSDFDAYFDDLDLALPNPASNVSPTLTSDSSLRTPLSGYDLSVQRRPTASANLRVCFAGDKGATDHHAVSTKVSDIISLSSGDGDMWDVEDNVDEKKTIMSTLPAKSGGGAQGRGARESLHVSRSVSPPLCTRDSVMSSVPLTESLQLPGRSEYSYHGKLLRAKGKWKRKWALEHFIIQHNVLLTCTKEEPFLVKVCIPLKNIVSIERRVDRKKSRKGGSFFDIKYIEAARRSGEKFGIMQCQAATGTEAEEWVTVLRKFRDRASSPGGGLVDYVVRENAEAAIRDLHDAMKKSGLYQMVARIAAAVVTDETNKLKEAFWKLAQHRMSENLRSERTRFEVGLTEAAIEVKLAKEAGAVQLAAAQRLGRLGVLLQKLSILVDSKRHLALMALKRQSDLCYTEKKANEMQEVMISSMMVDRCLSANRQIQFRKKRVAAALEAPLRRLLQEAFAAIQARSRLVQTAKELRRHAMLSLFRTKETEERQARALFVSKWRAITALQRRQEDGLRALFLSRRRWDLHRALRRWNAGCIIRTQKDIRACKILETVMQGHENKLTSGAFRIWVKWTSERGQLEALQIAANFNLVNSDMVSTFDKVPKERACYLMALVYRKLLLKTVSFGFHSMMSSSLRRGIMSRNYQSGYLLLARAHRSRVHFAFYQLVKFALRNPWSASQKHGVQRKRSVSLELIGDTRAMAAARIGDAMSHMRLTRLMCGLSMLRMNCNEVEFVRGIARLQCLQRMCHIIDRQRTALLAVTFCRLACTRVDLEIFKTRDSSPKAVADAAAGGGGGTKREEAEMLPIDAVAHLEEDVSLLDLPFDEQDEHLEQSYFDLVYGLPSETQEKSDTLIVTPRRVSVSFSSTMEGGHSICGGQMIPASTTVVHQQPPQVCPYATQDRNPREQEQQHQADGVLGVARTLIPPCAQWKRNRNHNTIRDMGIKRNASPAHKYVTVRPHHPRAVGFPPKKNVRPLPSSFYSSSSKYSLSPPFSSLYQSFTSSDLRFSQENNSTCDTWDLLGFCSPGTSPCSTSASMEYSPVTTAGYPRRRRFLLHPNDDDLTARISFFTDSSRTDGSNLAEPLQATDPLLFSETMSDHSRIGRGTIRPSRDVAPQTHPRPLTVPTLPLHYSQQQPNKSNHLRRVPRSCSREPSPSSVNRRTPLLGSPQRCRRHSSTSQNAAATGSSSHPRQRQTSQRHGPSNADSIANNIETWMLSSPQHQTRRSHQQQPQQSRRSQQKSLHSQRQKQKRCSGDSANPDPHSLSNCISPPQHGSSYLDFLLASANDSYLPNGTGETPDIDLDLSRVIDFVFDDAIGRQEIENLRIDDFFDHSKSTYSTDSGSWPHRAAEGSMSEGLDSGRMRREPHRSQRPECATPTERTSARLTKTFSSTDEEAATSTSAAAAATKRSRRSRTSYAHQEKQDEGSYALNGGNGVDSPARRHLRPDRNGRSAALSQRTGAIGEANQQQTYRACVVPTKHPLFVRKENCVTDQRSLGRRHEATTTRLMIVRAETGGACGGVDDFAVIADSNESPGRQRTGQKKEHKRENRKKNMDSKTALLAAPHPPNSALVSGSPSRSSSRKATPVSSDQRRTPVPTARVPATTEVNHGLSQSQPGSPVPYLPRDGTRRMSCHSHPRFPPEPCLSNALENVSRHVRQADEEDRVLRHDVIGRDVLMPQLSTYHSQEDPRTSRAPHPMQSINDYPGLLIVQSTQASKSISVSPVI